MALDPGTVRIGVAVSDSARSMAFPRPYVPAGPSALADCARIVREESVSLVVVGSPRTLDGERREAAAGAAEFAAALGAALEGDGVEVVLHDERLTTRTASARLREAGVSSRDARERVDGAAAAVLLEAWLAT